MLLLLLSEKYDLPERSSSALDDDVRAGGMTEARSAPLHDFSLSSTNVLDLQLACVLRSIVSWASSADEQQLLPTEMRRYDIVQDSAGRERRVDSAHCYPRSPHTESVLDSTPPCP